MIPLPFNSSGHATFLYQPVMNGESLPGLQQAFLENATQHWKFQLAEGHLYQLTGSVI